MPHHTVDSDAARKFLSREARLLERRLFAVIYEGAPSAGVVDALRGYRNGDGGFGQGLGEGGVPDDAHAIADLLKFFEHVGDRVEALVPAVAEWLPWASSFRTDPDDPGYGVTPLHLAPSPASPWVALFGEDVLAGHLERLARDQQADGGRPLTWEPPGAALLEWRRIETLRALRVPTAYGDEAAGS